MMLEKEKREWRKKPPVVLVVLDGFGVSLEHKGNAILNAEIANIDRFWNEYPHTLLNASGESVGLPWGEYGNSEVGHITLGVGSVIKQSMAMIKDSIANGGFFQNEVLIKAIENAKRNKKKLHVAGVFSSAGIHGHTDYFDAVLRLCNQRKFKNVYLHLFTDGRDVPPQSFNDFYERLQKTMQESGVGKIASLAGRTYSMDRISRWDRTKLTYEAMVGGGVLQARSAEEAINNSYAQAVFDENLLPVTIVDTNGKPVGPVEEGDSLIFLNHRRDRIRQIASFFVSDEEVIVQSRQIPKINNLHVVSMVFYELINMGVKIAFTPEEINRSSGEITSLTKVVSENNICQYHVAELEKFPHVSYFFNGGDKVVFEGEVQKNIPSPRVKGYEEKPEMSLFEVTEDLVKAISSEQYSFFVVNFANPDMVGHTGVFEAGIEAIRAVDIALGKLVDVVMSKGGTVLVTADHGNCEEMINLISGNISKEHTSNPVPLMLIDDRFRMRRTRKEKFEEAGNCAVRGLLADVAPTVVQLFGIDDVKDMSGMSLLDALE